MERKVLQAQNGYYLVWGDKAYRLDHPTNGDKIPGRQADHCLRGRYGPLVQAIAEAQLALGLPIRMAWRGVVNSLGDYAEVFPPTLPVPADQINQNQQPS